MFAMHRLRETNAKLYAYESFLPKAGNLESFQEYS